VQRRLADLNPSWRPRATSDNVAPDGDADVEAATFRIAVCLHCAGDLRPNVVFFGEGVPRPRVEYALALVDQAEALLVVGSSLTVYSGFRFVRRAHERGQPVVIVNLGETRGDKLATVLIGERASIALEYLV
jgi:NAD-dependent SIR2 family protein deacetylase